MRSGVFASNPRSHLPHHNLVTTFVLIALSGLISLGSTVKQRYDGTISCEFIPVNRCKGSDTGAKIYIAANHSF